MLSRRTFASLMGAAVSVGGAPASSASAPALDLDAIPLATHEAAMRLAIAAARANPSYPFGAVIVTAADHTVLAQGVNNSKTNPVLHGEIVAINDYVALHGNQGWADGIQYTTGEPCPMCMSAIVWAGIGGSSTAARLRRWRRPRHRNRVAKILRDDVIKAFTALSRRQIGRVSADLIAPACRPCVDRRRRSSRKARGLFPSGSLSTIRPQHGRCSTNHYPC